MLMSTAQNDVATAAPASQLLHDLMAAHAVRTPVRTVAIVGNAPLPPDEKRARRIDACDLVVRVNGFALDDDDAPARLGRRADVVVLQWGVLATPWLFEDYTRRLYLLNEPGQMFWDVEVVPPWWPPDLGLVRVPNRHVTIPLVQALGLQHAGHPQWATTGTAAVWLALHTFPTAQLTLAGFSFLDDPTQQSWAHAYGAPVEVNREHDLAAEAGLLRGLVADGRLEVLS